jgi:hypothetical protein
MAPEERTRKCAMEKRVLAASGQKRVARQADNSISMRNLSLFWAMGRVTITASFTVPPAIPRTTLSLRPYSRRCA